MTSCKVMVILPSHYSAYRRVDVFIFFIIIGLLLLGAGGVGLFITYDNFSPATLDWIQGNLTYGIFVLLGLAIVIFATILPR